MKHLRLIIFPAFLLLASLAIAHGAPLMPVSGNGIIDSVAFDSLMLRDADLPEGRHFAKMSHIKSIQAATLYKDPTMYSFIIGDVEQKAAQSIDGSDAENGSVLYFRFSKPLGDHGFIDGLIWGEDMAPTEEHPEEILAKDNVMVILSFPKGSSTGKGIKELMMKRLGL